MTGNMHVWFFTSKGKGIKRVSKQETTCNSPGISQNRFVKISTHARKYVPSASLCMYVSFYFGFFKKQNHFIDDTQVTRNLFSVGNNFGNYFFCFHERYCFIQRSGSEVNLLSHVVIKSPVLCVNVPFSPRNSLSLCDNSCSLCKIWIIGTLRGHTQKMINMIDFGAALTSRGIVCSCN